MLMIRLLRVINDSDVFLREFRIKRSITFLLYTADAADEEDSGSIDYRLRLEQQKQQ